MMTFSPIVIGPPAPINEYGPVDELLPKCIPSPKCDSMAAQTIEYAPIATLSPSLMPLVESPSIITPRSNVTPFPKCTRDALRRFTLGAMNTDRKSTRLNSSHLGISYAVFCLKKKKDRQKNRNYSHKDDLQAHRACTRYST